MPDRERTVGRIIVLGYIVRCPLGGMAWHYLHYVLGLHRLGYEVYFIEDSDDYPSCYDPTRHVTDTDCSYGLEFAGQAFARIGLPDKWGYYDAHQLQWHGPLASNAVDICSSAEVLLNISGANPLRQWMRQIPFRAFIDTDPAFEQVSQLTVPERRERADSHNSFFTFGENIPRGFSEVPDDGHLWQATRQPIVMDAWPQSQGNAEADLTTVMQWESYPYREFNGQRYELKGRSFMRYIDLPRRVNDSLLLALGSSNAPREELIANGWKLRDPLATTLTLDSYANFIRTSKAEFTVAKHGYVTTNTGWFSERSANYLASGRPVITQDTGFTEWMKCVGGVLAFNSPEEALARIAELNADYQWHCQQAREVARQYFDARKVLGRLLEQTLSE